MTKAEREAFDRFLDATAGSPEAAEALDDLVALVMASAKDAAQKGEAA